MHEGSKVKNHYFFGILLVLPQSMYAVYHLGHVFAIVHICRFGIEYLKVETTMGICHSSFISVMTLFILLQPNRSTLSITKFTDIAMKHTQYRAESTVFSNISKILLMVHIQLS